MYRNCANKWGWVATVFATSFIVGCNATPQNPTGPTAVAGLTDSQQQGSPAEAARKTYRVTIENLTAGQPFSPGVAITHTQAASLFHVGSGASEGIRAIAEDGDPSVALAALTNAAGIDQVADIAMPIHRSGGPGANTLAFEITAAANANRLSLAVMLICTNDGFTGVDSIKLPGGFSAETYQAAGYDAGTEANNERFTHIVDPCQAIGPVAGPPPIPNGNLRVATSGIITHHPGIQGGGDLLIAQHGWGDPVARVSVQRLK